MQSETELEAPDLATAHSDALLDRLDSLKLREQEHTGTAIAEHQPAATIVQDGELMMCATVQVVDGASKPCLWSSQSSNARGCCLPRASNRW